VHTSRLARLAMATAALSALLFFGGPLLIQLGALNAPVGFPIFVFGFLFGILSLLLGLFALYTTRPATGRAGRGLALSAAGIGALVVGIVFVARGPSANLPLINDISTDLEDPPEFIALAEVPANAGRDMSYPEGFAIEQRAGYPDLAGILVPTPPDETFQATVRAIEGLGWEIVDRDPARGHIEATATSRIFHFVDDIVVRIEPEGFGSRVDVRSKSRMGKGDLGANAARIRQLRDALE
jgi:Protein of unknown function (DUF1499)